MRKELDDILNATHEARDWIANLEPQERRRTGIASIKVGFNKVFGYYIEVSNANTDKVPSDYIRKQTLVNAERYITPELKEYETLVLNAEEEILNVERQLFEDLCQGDWRSPPATAANRASCRPSGCLSLVSRSGCTRRLYPPHTDR